MLADLDCSGSEETLLDCSRNTYGILHCYSYEVAGVVCEGIKFESLISFYLLYIASQSSVWMVRYVLWETQVQR